jgi:hypothetical protein
MSISGEFGAQAHLNDMFRKALWASRLIGHEGMREVAQIISQHVPDEDTELFRIDERISSVKKAQFYYKSFMGKAFEGLPPAVFQTLMLRNLAVDDQAAKILPEQTRIIARQVLDMGRDPICFRDANVLPLARLAFLSMNLATLETLHRSLQRGSLAPESMMTHKIYQTLVEPIKSLRLCDGDLEDAIFDSIREIDFIVNNHAEDSCQFIDLGRRYPHDIGSPQFLINFMGLADNPVLSEPLTQTVNVFLEVYRDPHDAFYALWKDVVMPFESILNSIPPNAGMHTGAARYAMAYAGLRLLENDDARQEHVFGKPLATLFQAIDLGVVHDSGYSPELIAQVKAVEASKILSNLYYHMLNIFPFGQTVEPQVNGEDMHILYMQLDGTEFLDLPWEGLMGHARKVREEGADLYNRMRSYMTAFRHLEPYPPPLSQTGTVLPTLRLIKP